mgnify:CR=1 FL=1
MITAVSGDSPSDVVQLLSALGLYCLTVLLGMAIHTFVTYPVLLRLLTPLRVRNFFAGIIPAQLVAFSTSSSAAASPDPISASSAVTSASSPAPTCSSPT